MPLLVSYARLVKLSHTVFALPFALLSAVLAGSGHLASGQFLAQLALVLTCMVSARSAAMAFNRIVDYRLDAANPRTADRPLQTGKLTLTQAWWFYAVCCLVFLSASAAFWLLWANPWPITMALPVLAALSLYSLTKRFTACCHLFLGAALGLSPLAAWLAVSPATFGLPAVALALAVTCWVAGFDILYALQDIPFDRAHHLHSLPVALGPAKALWISRTLHLAAVAALLLLQPLCPRDLGWLYLWAVALAAAVLLIEQSLVSARDFSRVTLAFFTCNGLVSLLLGAAGITDVLLP